jgi:hypothetical protein
VDTLRTHTYCVNGNRVGRTIVLKIDSNDVDISEIIPGYNPKRDIMD